MAGNDQQNAEALGSKELELPQLEPAKDQAIRTGAL
jgi:hypothetical protein